MKDIENLAELLNSTKSIISYETKNLTATGDNYGSLTLDLKIHLRDDSGHDEVLQAVAKLPPETEFLLKMFNTPVTFRNEISFYKNIIPTVKKFIGSCKLEEDFDCFPEFLGARLTLKNEDVVDKNAVLLLKNLKVDGYETVDRLQGFDFDRAKIALVALAKLHAIPLAMKLRQPENFKNKIKIHFQEYRTFQIDETSGNIVLDNFARLVQCVEECQFLVPRIREVLETNRVWLRQPKNSPNRIREPFATVIHTDSWVTNFMFKMENGKPTDCKILDLQLYEYGSPARDLLLFFFTSVQIPVVQRYYEDLIQTYYKTFADILKKFDCNLAAFSFQALQEELKLGVQQGSLYHCLRILDVVLAENEDVKHANTLSEEEMKSFKPPTERIKRRVAFILTEFYKHKWI